MRPMLAKTWGPRFSSFPCFLQPKLNGVRALYQDGVFQSRDEKFWKPGKLQHLINELRTIEEIHSGTSGLILDGELYVHGWKLGRINGAVAVNSSEVTEDTKQVEFHVFDIVDPSRTFNERRKTMLLTLYRELPHIKIVPIHLCADQNSVDHNFTHFVVAGYEGVMLRPDGPYEYGSRWSERAGKSTEFRSKFLWKKKQWEDAEFLCMGFTHGVGKADIGIGALILSPVATLGMQKDQPCFNVGTGFDDSERISLAANPPIGKLVRVRYPYLSEDGIPQCPSFVAVLS